MSNNTKLVIAILFMLGALMLLTKVCSATVASDISPNLKLGTPIMRELSEIEKAGLYLFEQVGENTLIYKKLWKVIDCESEWKIDAYNSKSNDGGLSQINEATWKKKAVELGYENYKTDYRDNIDMMIWIIKNDPRGINNWNASYKCHKVDKLSL